jgi:hypothetical protein
LFVCLVIWFHGPLHSSMPPPQPVMSLGRAQPGARTVALQ